MISFSLQMVYLHRSLLLDRNRPTRGGGGDGDCDDEVYWSRSRSGHDELLFARQAGLCQKEFAVTQRAVLIGFVSDGYENVDGRGRD